MKLREGDKTVKLFKKRFRLNVRKYVRFRTELLIIRICCVPVVSTIWPDPRSRSRSRVTESHSRGVDRQSRMGLNFTICYLDQWADFSQFCGTDTVGLPVSVARVLRIGVDVRCRYVYPYSLPLPPWAGYRYGQTYRKTFSGRPKLLPSACISSRWVIGPSTRICSHCQNKNIVNLLVHIGFSAPIDQSFYGYTHHKLQ